MSVNGSLLFAKYAYSPNKLRYCGPDDNRAIFDYCVAQQSDGGLVQLLEKFEGAYPYLKLIARSNKIRDTFNEKVVEAYWIGNELLNFVKDSDFYNSLKDRFGKKIPPKSVKWLLGKPPAGAKPHHAFHVLDVYTKTGILRGGVKTNVIETINNCLVMWGRVAQKAKGKRQNSPLNANLRIAEKLKTDNLIVEYQPIVMKKGKLIFGEFIKREIVWQYGDKSFIEEPEIGDWVSFHWGWVCDVLAPYQLKNLQYWTHYHLNIANQTI